MSKVTSGLSCSTCCNTKQLEFPFLIQPSYLITKFLPLITNLQGNKNLLQTHNVFAQVKLVNYLPKPFQHSQLVVKMALMSISMWTCRAIIEISDQELQFGLNSQALDEGG